MNLKKGFEYTAEKCKVCGKTIKPRVAAAHEPNVCNQCKCKALKKAK